MDIISTRPMKLLSKQGLTPYVFEYYGYEILVEKDVFPPDLSASSTMIFDLISSYNAKSSLDMGCGTGILTLKLSSISGNVVASDNHDLALENTRKNIKKLKNNNVSLIKSDLFNSFNDNYKFDLIVFNHPYYPSKNNFNFGIDGSGGSLLIKRFFSGLDKYLLKNAKILMPFSDFAGKEHSPYNIASSYGYKGLEVVKMNDALGTHRIYEFMR
jgi:release factor glutamine methyltransferase